MSGAAEAGCLSCRIVRGELETPGGPLLEGGLFHAHQDFACPIPGFVVLATSRHARAVDELTEAEAAEYGRLLRRIRAAQRAVLGVEHVYYFLNEDTRGHFHAWMLPRLPWMERFGRYVESVRPILAHAREELDGAAARAEAARVVGELRAALAAG